MVLAGLIALWFAMRARNVGRNPLLYGIVGGVLSYCVATLLTWGLIALANRGTSGVADPSVSFSLSGFLKPNLAVGSAVSSTRGVGSETLDAALLVSALLTIALMTLTGFLITPSKIAKPTRSLTTRPQFGGWLIPLWKVPATRALVALCFVLVIGCCFNAHGAFFKLGTHRDALRQASVFGILACGLTLVIISGGIDLAVGSVLALVAVSFSLMTIHLGWSPWIAVPACLLIGLECGAVSGALAAELGIQPFIATLAMMVFARGLAKTISGGTKISTAVRSADGTYHNIDVPAVFRLIDSSILQIKDASGRVSGNLAVVTVIFLICAAFAWIVLSRHRWGRQLYAIGGNEEAARLSGVPVKLTKVLAYAASGLLAAVAGICQAAQEQQGDPEAGLGYELTAIAIVVIGGTTLAGGRGGIGLTLLGTLTIGYLEKILSINAVPEASRLMLTGTIIVVAVLAQRRKK